MMIMARYVSNGNSLDKVKANQIDVVREKRRTIGSSISSILILLISVVFAFALITLSSDSVAIIPELDAAEKRVGAPDTQKLYGTHGSGRVLWDKNIATAAGVGRIPEDTAQGKLIGRRGALTDARRNLLILRQKLLNDDSFSGKKYSISGKIAGVVIHSERIKNNLYFLQVDIPLDKLMEGEIEIEIEE
jgi:hypothetical protein